MSQKCCKSFRFEAKGNFFYFCWMERNMVGGYKWSYFASSLLFTYLPFNGLLLYMSIRQKSNAVTITNFMVVDVVVVVNVSTNNVTTQKSKSRTGFLFFVCDSGRSWTDFASIANVWISIIIIWARGKWKPKINGIETSNHTT